MNRSRAQASNRRKTALIYVEGGGPFDADQAPCRRGFHALLEKCGYDPRSFQIIACGSRDGTAKDFRKAHDEAMKQFRASNGRELLAFVAMLVDSEDPVTDITKPCAHLRARTVDACDCPPDANDEQIFLMATCMETWIVADRANLQKHYHPKQDGKQKRPKQGEVINEAHLPPLNGLEERDRHEVHDKLEQATAHCSNNFEKNKRSFQALEALDPCTLRANLPSFRRMIEILDEKLGKRSILCPGEDTGTTDDNH